MFCDRLYQRYDFHHRGMINYKDFLMRLGVNVQNALTYQPQENAQACKAINTIVKRYQSLIISVCVFT